MLGAEKDCLIGVTTVVGGSVFEDGSLHAIVVEGGSNLSPLTALCFSGA